MAFLRHPIFTALLAISFAFNVLLWWAVFHYVPETEGQYTLQFSFQEGVTFLGTRSHFFIFPTVAALFFLLHSIIAFFALEKYPQLSYVFLVFLLVLQATLGFIIFVLFEFNRII
ncbi:MAG: hypothetical protein A2806_00345 [Candidatus Terrybacteria bacterium RIFCSPHIGHO2_01_FULL_48_17]|uniref:Uncharacterized protein n=1 Tax=Candidatus Terrybacteria bacterium RIFCSPHIGHO2_01_FULL_48_17 TaxID=1802362 RepID=A0A1G2PJS9_9BACT|nr:MAG: hypothetical protein A2806_00345 [Candidatus Terrybacteria bacterium RIFCSPHIGHO2_01_FULL_48_17]OHA53664.1 MAG: hypothetical protein A3A30_00665 [Candidatus Terrybacteria bacterium RIFCSPLOWO2_01_FULL_48_14]